VGAGAAATLLESARDIATTEKRVLYGEGRIIDN